MAKALTDDEKFLLDYIPRCTKSYKLYKYYGTDEEERSEIPDIWDKLNEYLGKAEDEYDRLRLEYANEDAQEAFWSHCLVEYAKNTVKQYNELLDAVENSSAEYFLYCNLDFTLIPLVRMDKPIYEIKVENGRLQAVDTGETVAVWGMETMIAGSYPYCVTSGSGEEVKVDCREFQAGCKYVFSLTEAPDFEYLNKQGKYIVCSDCGRIFDMSDGEFSFFKKKGLILPKRCDYCRSKRKAAKNGDSSLLDVL